MDIRWRCFTASCHCLPTWWRRGLFVDLTALRWSSSLEPVSSFRNAWCWNVIVTYRNKEVLRDYLNCRARRTVMNAIYCDALSLLVVFFVACIMSTYISLAEDSGISPRWPRSVLIETCYVSHRCCQESMPYCSSASEIDPNVISGHFPEQGSAWCQKDAPPQGRAIKHCTQPVCLFICSMTAFNSNMERLCRKFKIGKEVPRHKCNQSCHFEVKGRGHHLSGLRKLRYVMHHMSWAGHHTVFKRHASTAHNE